MYLRLHQFHMRVYIVQLLLHLFDTLRVTLLRYRNLLLILVNLILHVFNLVYCIPYLNLMFLSFQLEFHPFLMTRVLNLMHLPINPRNQLFEVPHHHVIVVDLGIRLASLSLDLFEFLLHLHTVLVSALKRHLKQAQLNESLLNFRPFVPLDQ